MTFNHIRKPWLYLLEGRQKSPFAPIQNNLIPVTGMPGAYVGSKETGVLYISQPVGFIVEDDEHALRLKDELAEWLVTKEAVPLEFDDEPGRTYYAEIEGTIEDFNRFVDQREGVVTFLCANPYSYSHEKTLSFPADIVTVENRGTAEADPIFELTAKKKATFAMISNEDNEYNLIGKPADVDEQIVDEKTLIFSERGDTLNTWSDAGTQFDNGKVTGGQLGTDGTGIHPLSYGSPGDWEGWYGPA